MTKVSVLVSGAKKESKNIQVNSVLTKDLNFEKCQGSLDGFDNVCLIVEKYNGKEDLILAWDDEGGDSVYLYSGHWNDGVV